MIRSVSTSKTITNTQKLSNALSSLLRNNTVWRTGKILLVYIIHWSPL